jgi:hypothetical protein
MNTARATQPPPGARVSQNTNITIGPGVYNPYGTQNPAMSSAIAGSQIIASGSRDAIDAYDQGVRERQMNQAIDANYAACMATEGWVEQQ